MSAPSPRSRTGAFSSAHARLRAVRSCARLRSFLAAQRLGEVSPDPSRPRPDAALGCDRLPHPRRPRTPANPSVKAGFPGARHTACHEDGGVFWGVPAPPKPGGATGAGHSLRVPGGAAPAARRAARALARPPGRLRPRLSRACRRGSASNGFAPPSHTMPTNSGLRRLHAQASPASRHPLNSLRPRVRPDGRVPLPPGVSVAAPRDGHRLALRSGITAGGASPVFLTAQACSSAVAASTAPSRERLQTYALPLAARACARHTGTGTGLPRGVAG